MSTPPIEQNPMDADQVHQSMEQNKWFRDLFHEAFKRERPLHYTAIVLAILFGVGGLFLELSLHHQFAEQKQTITDIVQSSSTTYLPDWPENGNDLKDLVSSVGSGDELIVQIDTIGYLSFTHPDKFKDFFWALHTVAAKENVSIQILTSDEPAAANRFSDQFDKNMDNDITKLTTTALRQYLTFPAYLPLFAATPFGRQHNKSTQRLTPNDYDNFIDAAMFIENDYCSKLVDVGVQVHMASSTTPAASIGTHGGYSQRNRVSTNDIEGPLKYGPFFWLWSEGTTPKQMIFAYPRFSGLQKGYVFKTSDPHLMEIFHNQFVKSFSAATAISKGQQCFPNLYKRIKTTP